MCDTSQYTLISAVQQQSSQGLHQIWAWWAWKRMASSTCARPTSRLAVGLCQRPTAQALPAPLPQQRQQTAPRCTFQTAFCPGCLRLPLRPPLQTPPPSRAQPGSMSRASGRSSQRPALQLRRLLQPTPCSPTSLMVSFSRISLLLLSEEASAVQAHRLMPDKAHL